jgi:putative transposase
MPPSSPPTLPLPGSFDGIFFVTIRLHDALPDSFCQNLGLQYYTKQVKFAPQADCEAQLHLARKRLFARFDQTLDLGKQGLSYFREPALAQILAAEILGHNGFAYDLFAYSILPNHAHLLFQLNAPVPDELALDGLQNLRFPPLRDIINKIQSNTALPLKKAVQSLNSHHDPSTFQKHSPKGGVLLDGKIWHESSFDFQIKDAAEFEKVARFMLLNPVAAELVADWSNWPFSFVKSGG